MDAGRMNERVTFVRPAAPLKNGGVPVPQPSTVLFRRIAAEVGSAMADQMERIFGGQVMAMATHYVKTRLVADVRLTDEVIWHDGGTDRTLKIAARRVKRRERELLLAVRELVQ